GVPGHRRAPERGRRVGRADRARPRRLAHRGLPGQRPRDRGARRHGRRRLVHGAGRPAAGACRALRRRRRGLRRGRGRRSRRRVRLRRRRAARRRRRGRELVAAAGGGPGRARDPPDPGGRHARRAAGGGGCGRRATARHAAARDQREQRRACLHRPERRARPHGTGAFAVMRVSSGCGFLAAAAVSALLAGCVTRAPLTDAYEGPARLPEPLAERYELELEPVEAVTDEVRERRDFAIKRIVLPAREAVNGLPPIEELTFEYYDVIGEDTTPVIVVLPIANGNMMVSRYFARYFASRGWAALVIDHARDPMEDLLEDPERIIRQNIIDYRRVLDWVERQPEIDSVGIFG